MDCAFVSGNAMPDKDADESVDDAIATADNLEIGKLGVGMVVAHTCALLQSAKLDPNELDTRRSFGGGTKHAHTT